MKRSMFLLASLMLSSALYTQAEELLFTREQVLDLFARYNPAVLEKAKQEADYQTLLEQFLTDFQGPDTLQNRFSLIAGIRNFDNSIRLHALTEQYIEKATWARMAAQDASGLRSVYQQDVQQVMGRIYAVTLQTNRWQLQELKKAVHQNRHSSLNLEERLSRKIHLKAAIKAQKEQIRALEDNAGDMVLAFTQQHLAQTEQQLKESLLAGHQASSQEDSARQASNLQIKTNHKKPVAE